MRGERQVMSLDGELQITGDPAGPVSAPIETGSTHT
jgi:hypothetical protein